MDEQRGVDQGLRVLSYLISGVIVYGGLGWLLDRWLGTSYWLPTGLILGAVSGVYIVIRRYGRLEND